MFTAENYQLLDFGGGRRLEQFGPLRLDRPCPAAESLEPAEPELWQTALARYERTGARAAIGESKPIFPRNGPCATAHWLWS